MAGGLLALPFLLSLLALRRLSSLPAIVFIAAALLTAGLFLWDYHPVGGFSHSLGDALLNLPQATTFAAGFLGSAFYPYPQYSFTLGFVGLGLFAAATAFILHTEIIRNKRFPGRMLALWSVAGAFVLMAFSAAVSRLNLGMDAALAPRYVTVSLTFWACLLPIILQICLHSDRSWLPTAIRRSCIVPVATLCALLILNFTPRYERDAKEFNGLLASQASSMRQNVYVPALFEFSFYGTLADGANRIAFLHNHHLAVFAPDVIQSPALPALTSASAPGLKLPFCQGHVDSAYRVDAKRLVLGGWLASNNGRRTADWAELTDNAGSPVGAIPLTQYRDLPRKLLRENTPGGFFSGVSYVQNRAGENLTLRMIGIFTNQAKSNCILKASLAIGPVRLQTLPLTSPALPLPLASPPDLQGANQSIDPATTSQIPPWPGEKTIFISGHLGSAARAVFTINTSDVTSDLAIPFKTNAGAAGQTIEFSFKGKEPFDVVLPGDCPQNAWCTATLPRALLASRNEEKLQFVATDPGALPGEWLLLGAPMLTHINPDAARLY